MRVLILAAASLALAGCATVTRGTTNQIQIYSEPSGANVRTSLSQVCTTPCTLQVNRKDEFTVVVDKPGYVTQEVQVKTQLAGAGAAGFAGNVLVGGVVGMGVDAATGSTLEHTPNPVRVTLTPVGKAYGKRGARPKPTPAPPPVAPAPVEDVPES
jgi:type IV pilus biogenesis protein CpaD/CtpE